MSDIIMNTGKRIKYIREYYLGMNQADFYIKALGKYGTGRPTQCQSQIENGRRTPKTKGTLLDYADRINSYIKKERPDLLPIDPAFLTGETDAINATSALYHVRKRPFLTLIDDLIKQIEDIPTIKESDKGKMILMGEGMKREIIKILEEAKK